MKAPWVMIKYDEKPNKIVCLRCGHSIIAPWPCTINDAVLIGNAFTEKHSNCKEVETKDAQTDSINGVNNAFSISS